jgi:hypothetical protein
MSRKKRQKIDTQRPASDGGAARVAHDEKRNPKDTCHVANARCSAPAGWRAGSGYAENRSTFAEFVCEACSLPVCGSCSGIVNGRRICDNCHEQAEPGGTVRR